MQAQGDIEKATGYKINWCQFGGSGVIACLFDLLMRYVEHPVVPWKGKV